MAANLWHTPSLAPDDYEQEYQDVCFTFKVTGLDRRLSAISPGRIKLGFLLVCSGFVGLVICMQHLHERDRLQWEIAVPTGALGGGLAGHQG